MRSILRTLPIRWQITVLHATILALVLAVGGLGLWNAQRQFQYDGLITKQLTEARALIPEAVPPALQKDRYAKLIAAILPPTKDSAIAVKRIALLDPNLATQVFPPDAPALSRDEMEAVVSKLIYELFPLDEDPLDTRKKLMSLDPKLATELSSSPAINQAELQRYMDGLAQQLGAKEKDRGITILAYDGSVLAQNGFGPTCMWPSFVAKDALAAKVDDTVVKKLNAARYIGQIDRGQLTLLLPVMWQGNRPMALAQICVPTDSIDASLNQLAVSLIIGWMLVVGIATALGVTATRRVLRPLDRVVATSGRIAAGDLQQRVGLPPGRTEIDQLGAAFDAMVARLEQAFAAQRRFVADAAHELRTPLTALSTSVELLLMGAADNDRATAQRLLRHLDSELSRVIRLTNDLLTLSRFDARPQIVLRPTDLSTLLEEVGEHSRTLLRGQELAVDVAPALWVQGDSDRLRQVVLNLLDNACKYTSPGGRITLRAYTGERPPGEQNCRTAISSIQPPTSNLQLSAISSDQQRYGIRTTLQSPTSSVPRSSVVIEVEDTGVGIPADALSHLFERFYRVDSARARASGGSGLGLAIVQVIVLAHHGQVDVQSTSDVGTCMRIRLPQPL